MRLRLTLLALTAGLIGSPALAAPDVGAVAKAFGNTIVSTYPDGRKGELWLEADGSYNAKGRRGDPSSGHWTLSGDKLCLKQSRPMAVPFHFCTPVPRAGLSGTWSAKAVTGEPIQVRLVHGRQVAGGPARSPDREGGGGASQGERN